VGRVNIAVLTPLVPRRSVRQGYRGRSPDSRLSLLANAFLAILLPVAGPVGVRPRSQWRVREGIAPSSRQLHLYSEPGKTLASHIMGCYKCQVRRHREIGPGLNAVMNCPLVTHRRDAKFADKF
jgi:hypothetical protein